MILEKLYNFEIERDENELNKTSNVTSLFEKVQKFTHTTSMVFELRRRDSVFELFTLFTSLVLVQPRKMTRYD